jgi:hypothetical protein
VCSRKRLLTRDNVLAINPFEFKLKLHLATYQTSAEPTGSGQSSLGLRGFFHSRRKCLRRLSRATAVSGIQR